MMWTKDENSGGKWNSVVSCVCVCVCWMVCWEGVCIELEMIVFARN